jgi:hypothetical protein
VPKNSNSLWQITQRKILTFSFGGITFALSCELWSVSFLYHLMYILSSWFHKKTKLINSYLFNEFVCKLGFFWYEWARLKREWNEHFKDPWVPPKKGQFTQERVEYNVFLFDDPLKGSKSLKIFKINLTFLFDKLSHLAKSVHIGENSQILTVSNKKNVNLLIKI